MHWNVSIGPDKWPIFGRFLLKCYFHWNVPRGTKKIPPIWRTPVDDVIAWRHCKSSICWLSMLTWDYWNSIMKNNLAWFSGVGFCQENKGKKALKFFMTHPVYSPFIGTRIASDDSTPSVLVKQLVRHQEDLSNCLHSVSQDNVNNYKSPQFP
jgi:hypothetical protein